MLRDVKYLFKISATYIFGVPAAACTFIAAYYYLFGENKHNGEYISGMLVAIISMMSLAICMNFYSTFGNIALSMGTTRKSYFFTTQVMKVFVAIAMFAASYFASEALKFFYKINFFKDNSSLITCFGITLILGTLGEAIGIVSSRWGRFGMKIYIGACALGGACVGIISAIGPDEILGNISVIVQSPWLIVTVLVVLSIILTCVNGVLYKKSAVN